MKGQTRLIQSNNHLMKRSILVFMIVLAFSILALSGCSPKTRCDQMNSTQECLRILFIGNSYTYVNDLPTMFSNLASSGNHLVETGMLAQGGLTLEEHVSDPNTSTTLDSQTWNFVILQEQSEIPAFEQSRIASMYPAARQLVNSIRAQFAKPIFFLTWGHKDGMPDYGFPDFTSMQTQITLGYRTIANQLAVQIAPIGVAWAEVTKRSPGLDLWQADGSHPTLNGTYLAACVLYAVIFRDSPVGLSHPTQVSADNARFLQTIAAEVVLNNPALWNLH
jgi:hypothetical protein